MSTTSDKLGVYLANNRARLSKLPYFASEPNPLATLKQLWGDGDIAALFGDRLQGMAPVYRQIALEFLTATQREPQIDQRSGFASGDAVVVCKGDLHVTGNLRVNKCVVVLGDLIVDRSVMMYGMDYPTLYVGGDLRCKNFFANEAETVCCGDLKASEAIVLIYNHTVTVASSVQARVLVTDDAYIDGRVEAAKRSDGTHDDYRAFFGIEFDDAAEDFDAAEHIHDPLIAALKSA